MMKKILAAALLLAVPGVLVAQHPVSYSRAQALVDSIVAQNPGMLDAILHISPTLGAKNIVVAAHLRHANGEASGEDDLGVATTGAPLVEIQKDGRRLGVLVQLRDTGRHAIGALGLMYPYKPGDDVEASVRRSFAIRDALAKHIGSISTLAATTG